MFGVSRQSIYQQQARLKRRSEELKRVKDLVIRTRMSMPRLGTRKLYYLLKDEFKSLGIKIGRDALFKYLKSESLLIRPKKNYTKTTHSNHWLRKHPNLMKDVQPERIEQYLVSDITHLASEKGSHYLSLVTDAYSRKIMGYHLSDDQSAQEVVQALKMASSHRITTHNTIHHSDRGLQYCSKIYQKELKNNSIKPSMTDGYDCYQNALAERINGILKQEFLIYKCKNKRELGLLIKESINTYNTKRPHLSLNYKTPNFVHNKNAQELTPEH